MRVCERLSEMASERAGEKGRENESVKERMKECESVEWSVREDYNQSNLTEKKKYYLNFVP